MAEIVWDKLCHVLLEEFNKDDANRALPGQVKDTVLRYEIIRNLFIELLNELL